jgi:hypothetical protein
MLIRLRSKLTYANVMSTIAVFCALTGVTFAIAKLPRHSVGTRQLKKGAVTSKKIHKGAVRSKRIHRNAVTASKIRSGAVGRSEIAKGAVGTGQISNQAVTRGKIADSAIPLLGTLRSGQTLRGSFDLGGDVDRIRDGQSFQFPLENAPAANVIDASVASPAFTSSCSGVSGANGQTPNAAPGQLCVYITSESGLTPPLLIDSGALTRLGFGLTARFTAIAPTNHVSGLWAVTAP